MKIIIQNKFGNEIDTKIQNILDEFLPETEQIHYSDKLLDIIVTDQVYDDLLKYSGAKMKSLLITNGYSPHLAVTILPEDENYSKFQIILDTTIFDEFQFFSTIVHELTHVKDYINYFDKNGNIYLGCAFFNDFYYWTEFNAKRVGLKVFMRELNKIGGNIDLERTALSFVEVVNSTPNFGQKVYELVHFFARISLIDENGGLNVNHTYFPRSFISLTFGESAFDLYDVLYRSLDYNKFELNKKLINYYLNELTA